jgi:D-aminoacyl-tRNA deacylase
LRAIVQRVTSASVVVDGQEVGKCGVGFLLLVGIHRDDTEEAARKLAARIGALRMFNDEEGKMNLALADVPGSGVLAISNFTVYGETKKNRRPSFVDSAPYERARELFDLFVGTLRSRDIPTQTGVFGAHMEVSLVNDGPVTVIVEV